MPKFFLVQVACVIVTTFAATGCRETEANAPSSSRAVVGSQTGLTIDAGVLFLDESAYLCVPFQQLGIDDSSRIESLISSCDCVRPSWVQYLSTAGKRKSAVRLDFDAAKSFEGQSRSYSLAVRTKIRFVNGSQQSFDVCFVHSPPIEPSDRGD
ncbi:MAG: hypothetical protein NTY42_09715 [Planctomycetota bacterium]|jgi:hypothetical protein|nr:hypothetical protein [Planctomycetota bacterium]